MDTNKNQIIVEKSLKDYGDEIKNLTVDEVSKETGKSARYIKSHLTRYGISCIDYDGEKRKADAETKANEVSKNNTARKKLSDDALAEKISTIRLEAKNKSDGVDAYSANEIESNSIFSTVSIIFGILWLGLSIWGFNENGAAFFLIWLVISFVMLMASIMLSLKLSDSAEKSKISQLTKDGQDAYNKTKEEISKTLHANADRSYHLSRYGSINQNLVCPHCQTKGEVLFRKGADISFRT